MNVKVIEDMYEVTSVCGKTEQFSLGVGLQKGS